MKATFEKSIDILVKAYLNDTLKHGSCRACAVANLLADRCKSLGIDVSRWVSSFVTPELFDCRLPQLIASENELVAKTVIGFRLMSIESLRIMMPEETERAVQETHLLFDGADYTKAQYAAIENAFETAPQGESEDQWMFNGLMAVVEILADIDGVSLEAKQEAIALFVK